MVVLAPPLLLLAEAVFWGGGHGTTAFLRAMWLDHRQWGLLARSFQLATLATMLAALFAIPYAVVTTCTNLAGKGFFRVAYLSPLLVPPYLQGIAWESLLLGGAGPSLGTALDSGWWRFCGAAVALAAAYYPFLALLTIGGLDGVERRYEEAGVVVRGVGPTFWKVTLPLAAPHVLAGVVFVFVFSLMDFGIPDLFRLRVFPVEVFVQFSGLYNERAAVALSVPFLGIAAVLVWIQAYWMRERRYVGFAAGGTGRLGQDLGGWRWALSLAPGVVLLITAGVPLGFIVANASGAGGLVAVLRSSWHTLWFNAGLALVAAAAATGLALPIGLRLVRGPSRGRLLWDALTQVPFAVPALLVGIAVIRLWNRPATAWLYEGWGILVVGYLARILPFCVRTVTSSLHQVHWDLEAAAIVARKGYWTTLSRIVVPLNAHGLLTSFFVAFVLAFGDLGVSLLVVPPGASTLLIKVYNYLHYGSMEDVANLAGLLLIVQWVAVGAFFLVWKRLGTGWEARRC